MTKETLDLILEQLQEMKTANAAVAGRLKELEEKGSSGGSGGGGDQPPDIKQQESRVTENLETRYYHAQPLGREKTLNMTFGDGDISPTALILFLDHYELAMQQNMAKLIPGWSDPKFRANELRYQLRGEVALWLAQESAMLNAEWMRDDVEIIKRLKERFMGTECIELNIIAFEDLRQGESECLATYMTRCQRRGYEAFCDMDPGSTQQRIVWKFLSGIRDQNVRAQVIKEKWMVSTKEAKSYQEILKIAETAKMHILATSATGAGAKYPTAKVAAMSGSRVKDRRESRGSRHSSGESTKSSSSNSSSNSANYGASETSGSTMPNFRCHYCNTTDHYGGWKLCPKRLNNDANWKPGTGGVDKKKGFQ